MPKWIQSFTVTSSSGKGEYTVSLADDGSYGCSCPHWKFRRQPCRHIAHIQDQTTRNYHPSRMRRTVPTCQPANVPQVTSLNETTLLVPLIPLQDAHFLATVIVDLLAYGIPYDEIHRRYHLPSTTSRRQYLDYVMIHGRRVYTESGQERFNTTQTWNLPDVLLPGESPHAYELRTGCPQDLLGYALTSNNITNPSLKSPTSKPHSVRRRRILTSE